MDTQTQNAPLKPSPRSRETIVSAVGSQLNLCFTCGSCSAECPINTATGQLDPRALVRRAAYGQRDVMLRRKELWYCLQCNRCSNVCPMKVTPAELIKHLRRAAVLEGVLTEETAGKVEQLHAKLHRVRWHAASSGSSDAVDAFDPAPVDRAAADGGFAFLPGKTNLPDADAKKKPKKKKKGEPLPLRAESETYANLPTNLSACFTCNECRGACPVCIDPAVYDPLRFFRAAQYDLDSVLKDPSIWLCIGCQSCTAACAQGVQGHMVMLRLQQLAAEKGSVDADFAGRWRDIDKSAYTAWVSKVDALLG